MKINRTSRPEISGTHWLKGSSSKPEPIRQKDQKPPSRHKTSDQGDDLHTLHASASFSKEKIKLKQHNDYAFTDSNRPLQSSYSVTGSTDDERATESQLGPLGLDYPDTSHTRTARSSLCHSIEVASSSKSESEGRIQLSGHVARRKCPDREVVLWDSILPGFGLRMYPSGRKRWIVRFIERKKARQETVGDAATMDVHKARRIARKRLEAAALHGLPQKPKVIRRKGRSRTFADVFETFRQDRPYAWAPATERSNLGTMSRVLLPHFGTRLIDEITKADVVAWRDSMSNRSGSCNRLIPNLSAILVYAEKLGLRKRGSNPARGLKRYKRAQKTRHLSGAEYRRLDLRLREFGNERFAAMIRLYIYTGARRGELAGLRWKEVAEKHLELEKSKTGPKAIRLSGAARSMLLALPRDEPDELVFIDEARRPLNIEKLWAQFRAFAGLRDLRLHDLRHSYASIAVQNGIDLEPIGRLLGHSLTETTERYAHLNDGCVAEAAETLGSDLFRLLGVKP